MPAWATVALTLGASAITAAVALLSARFQMRHAGLVLELEQHGRASGKERQRWRR